MNKKTCVSIYSNWYGAHIGVLTIHIFVCISREENNGLTAATVTDYV